MDGFASGAGLVVWANPAAVAARSTKTAKDNFVMKYL
jgi:hypothetical protein